MEIILPGEDKLLFSIPVQSLDISQTQSEALHEEVLES